MEFPKRGEHGQFTIWKGGKIKDPTARVADGKGRRKAGRLANKMRAVSDNSNNRQLANYKARGRQGAQEVQLQYQVGYPLQVPGGV